MPEQSDMYMVKVRFRGERCWYFAGSQGRLTRLRLHAVLIDDRARAESAARGVLEDERLAAARVDEADGRRTVARFGETTPPAPAAHDFSSYCYLVAVRGRRGVFHVKDAAGEWANVDLGVYEQCHAEAVQARLETTRLTIHGCTATISTRGLRFVQRS